MNRTSDDDAARLLALLVAICGPGINDYRPRVKALVATLKANARVKSDERFQTGGRHEVAETTATSCLIRRCNGCRVTSSGVD
jgi:hypothetical protein